MENGNKIKHILTVSDFSTEQFSAVLNRAEELRKTNNLAATLTGKVGGLLFLQSSTRTRLGFNIAIKRLGGSAVELFETKYQYDMEKPESFMDTGRVISDFCNFLVIRHADMQEIRNLSAEASIPVINAGGGIEHHPTQALVDLYAIYRKFGHLDNLRIGLAGNLAGSRAASSFIESVCRFVPKELRLMAPDELMPRTEVRHFINKLISTDIRTYEHLETEGLDILYMAGYPARYKGMTFPEEKREKFRLTKAKAIRLPDHALILCPLPRVDEIDRDVDKMSQAGYFLQSADGQFVRMATLEQLLSNRGVKNGK